MSAKHSLVTVVPISNHSRKDLARKGWRTPSEVEDELECSSPDELSISWTSSPPTPDTKNKSCIKYDRHVVTKLNFDDCIVKGNRKPVAVVQRFVEPHCINETQCSSTKPKCVDIQSEITGDVNILCHSDPSLSSQLTCVAESPGVSCDINYFRGLEPKHTDTIPSNEESDTSQEIPLQTPKCFNLKETLKLPSNKELDCFNSSTSLEERLSPPIVSSSRFKVSSRKMKKLIKLDVIQNEMLDERTKLINSKTPENNFIPAKKCSSPCERKSKIGSSDIEIMKENDSAINYDFNLRNRSLLTPVASPEHESNRKCFSSPILGSKKRRYRIHNRGFFSNQKMKFTKMKSSFDKMSATISLQNTLDKQTNINGKISSLAQTNAKIKFLHNTDVLETPVSSKCVELQASVFLEENPLKNRSNSFTTSSVNLLPDVPNINQNAYASRSVFSYMQQKCQLDYESKEYDLDERKVEGCDRVNKSRSLSPNVSRSRIRRKLKFTKSFINSEQLNSEVASSGFSITHYISHKKILNSQIIQAKDTLLQDKQERESGKSCTDINSDSVESNSTNQRQIFFTRKNSNNWFVNNGDGRVEESHFTQEEDYTISQDCSIISNVGRSSSMNRYLTVLNKSVIKSMSEKEISVLDVIDSTLAVQKPKNCERHEDATKEKNELLGELSEVNVPSSVSSDFNSLCQLSPSSLDNDSGKLNLSLCIESGSSDEELQMHPKPILSSKSCTVTPPSSDIIISQEDSPSKSFSSTNHISSELSEEPDANELTPQKAQQSTINMDSGKKKKRLKKNGLAARLQSLLSHKQAAGHLCKYEVSVGLRRSGYSMFKVKRAWIECNRLLILCYPCSEVLQRQEYNKDFSEERRSETDENSITDLCLVITEPEILALNEIKENAVIKVYPPWQSMYVLRLMLTVLLDVTHVELDSGAVIESLSISTLGRYESKTIDCLCMKSASKGKNCDFKFPDQGKQLWGLLCPTLKKNHNTLSQIGVNILPTLSHHNKKSKGTIADTISQFSSKNWICVRVIRIFCHRLQKQENDVEKHCANDCNLSWSILGEDSTGECCEITLGTLNRIQFSNFWQGIINGNSLGKFYRITNLKLSKRLSCDRMQEVRGFLWKNLDTHCTSHQSSSFVKQRFFYIFAVTSESCVENFKEDISLDVLPKLVTLLDTQKKENEDMSRFSVLAKALVFWNGFLYIIDCSLKSETNDAVKCLKVEIKSSCHIHERLTNVVYLQDLLLNRGELVADKYSRVFYVDETVDPACSHIDIADISLLKSLPINAPVLGASSQINDLVFITGFVSEVDEESALKWFVCKQCGLDLFEHQYHHQLICKTCGLTEPVTKLSLHVIVACDNLPDQRIKVKLLQKSIVTLLPRALEKDEVAIETILNKPIGPLACVILEDCQSSINNSPSHDRLLQELQLLGVAS